MLDIFEGTAGFVLAWRWLVQNLNQITSQMTFEHYNTVSNYSPCFNHASHDDMTHNSRSAISTKDIPLTKQRVTSPSRELLNVRSQFYW